MNWLESDPKPLTIRHDQLSRLPEDLFSADSPTRLNVVIPDAVLPLLVVRRHSPKLTVLNNGAVDVGRAEGRPIFQRSSWWREIKSNQIYVCDPGTVGSEAMTLNWMQAAPPSWLAHKLTHAIRSISRLLGVSSGVDRTYFGSSAGGFSALSCLAYDPTARAIINNAQFDWTRWYAPKVQEVIRRSFPGYSAADVRSKWPYRANALHALARREVHPVVDYWVNLASRYDRTVQLPLWSETLTKHPLVAASFTLHCYYDDNQGHNPLSRDHTLHLLNADRACISRVESMNPR